MRDVLGDTYSRGQRHPPCKMALSRAAGADYLAYAVEAVQQIHASGDPGDVLLFLTGQQEVDAACKLLSDSQQQGSSRSGGKGKGSGGGPQHLVVLPLYSSLSAKAQLKSLNQPDAMRARSLSPQTLPRRPLQSMASFMWSIADLQSNGTRIRVARRHW